MLLALESSGLTAGCAVIDNGRLLGEYNTNFKKTHSETLLPMAEALLNMLEISPADLTAVAVSAGPGSFTGLRIGSATAKGIALALDIPIVPVPTTAGIAYNLYDTPGILCPIMDARRDQVYTGCYRWKDSLFETLTEQRAMDIEELSEELKTYKENIIFLGDGVNVYKDRIDEILESPHSYAPEHLRYQRAGAMGMLAWKYLEEGRAIPGDEHSPFYLRKSQAERELLEKEAESGK